MCETGNSNPITTLTLLVVFAGLIGAGIAFVIRRFDHPGEGSGK